MGNKKNLVGKRFRESGFCYEVVSKSNLFFFCMGGKLFVKGIKDTNEKLPNLDQLIKNGN